MHKVPGEYTRYWRRRETWWADEAFRHRPMVVWARSAIDRRTSYEHAVRMH